jgi:hypothetical protein
MVNLDMANTVIGLRNSNYKYYRNRQDVNSKINLYDLINDPDEINNISADNKEIVLKMENILENIRKNSTANQDSELTDEEIERAKKELKKLGYT